MGGARRSEGGIARRAAAALWLITPLWRRRRRALASAQDRALRDAEVAQLGEGAAECVNGQSCSRGRRCRAVPVPTSRDALTSCEIHFAKSVVALPAATAVGALTAATVRARPILGNA